jgi:hypothetical protein
MSALAHPPASGCDQASLRSNRFNAVAMISSDRLHFCFRSVRGRERVAHRTFRSAEAASHGDASVRELLCQLVLRRGQTVQSFVMAGLVRASPGHPRNSSTVGADSMDARHKTWHDETAKSGII